MLPRQAPEPAGRPEAHVLPRLRLTRSRPRSQPSLLATLLVSAGSGLLLSAALPPIDAGPVAFLGLVPFLWAVRDVRPRRAALAGYVFGVAYLGAIVWWITIFGLIAWVPLTFGFAGFFALFAAAVPLVWSRERPVLTAVAVAAAWVVPEFLRGIWPLGGFTWGTLGTTQHGNPLLLPLASVTGVWGISFVVALANALVLSAVDRVGERAKPLRLVALAAAAALFPALIPAASPSGPAVDVAIVQGNVPKGVELDRFLEDRVVAENHARLHRTLAADPPDLAVWPENSVDRDPGTSPDLRALIEDAVPAVGAPTLIGAVTDAPGNRFYNENVLLGPDLDVRDRYRKLHPVPFGEYVPFRRYLGFIEELRQVPRDMAPGDRRVVFEIPGARFGSVICFENAFGDLTRRVVGEGAGFLVVSTNNASFLRTSLSRQHLVMSQLRAAETRRWVVHAAISGISAFVDPGGRIVERTELFEPAILRRSIPQGRATTPYTRFGDWFPWAAGITLGGVLLLAGRRPERRLERRRQRRPEPEARDPERVLVVLPTYNERDTAEEVITRLLLAEPRAEVLVVDDGSPDGTAAIVRKVAEREPRVSVLERPGKRGLAGAYLAGFRRALSEGHDVVVEMDADLSHQPEELPRLLRAARENDLVIGSRYVAGGAVRNWGRLRRMLSRGGNAYARGVLAVPLTDATSGYRAYRRALLEELVRGGIGSEGYAFQIELAYRAWRGGWSVAEVPITFREREHGRSKISRRIVLEAVWNVASWGIRDRFRRRPASPD